MSIDLNSEKSPERQYLEQHYPDILDMAAQMIIAGCKIVENEGGGTAGASCRFEKNPDGSFQFTYNVFRPWQHGPDCPHTCCT